VGNLCIVLVRTLTYGERTFPSVSEIIAVRGEIQNLFRSGYLSYKITVCFKYGAVPALLREVKTRCFLNFFACTYC
jgi:hypothetical protein